MFNKRFIFLLISAFCTLPFFAQSYVSSEKISFAHVPGGTFMMGCTGQCGGQGTKAELPRHEVSVNSFEIAQTEVTNAQYCEFLNDARYGETIPVYDDNGWNRKFFSSDAQIEWKDGKWQPMAGMGNYPMVSVSWFGAKSFCDFYGYRLPYEAEWEFAARGNQIHAYSGSSEIEKVGWIRENSNNEIHPVALLSPTDYGTYDMSGNVWEWCYDWFDEDYYNLKTSDNPVGPGSGDGKVNRGGSYDYPDLSARVSQRNYDNPTSMDKRIGFRPVKATN